MRESLSVWLDVGFVGDRNQTILGCWGKFVGIGKVSCDRDASTRQPFYILSIAIKGDGKDRKSFEIKTE
jgi:hypothetical protein